MEFADFIAPIDAASFRSQYYGNRPVHIQRQGDGASMLSWQRFNDVLAITPYWNEDTLKVFFKSRAALRENYCDTTELRAGTSAPVNPAKVKALLGLGASLIANQSHRVCPEVGAVAAMLEREFAARVSANVYCSFKGVQAFQTHYDLHDVFAVQAEGEKTWRIYESRADAPVAPLPPGDEIEKWLTESRGKLLFEAQMKPGDILYLPRGQYHDALTGSQASLHVTFGISPATGLALFRLLENAVTQEGEFRAYLPDARSEPDLRARLTAFRERLTTMFGRDVAAGARTAWRLTSARSATLDIELSAPATISAARIEEDIARGQRVAAYRLEAEQPLSRGTTVGYTKIDRFPQVTTRRVRLLIETVDAPQRPVVKLYS